MTDITVKYSSDYITSVSLGLFDLSGNESDIPDVLVLDIMFRKLATFSQATISSKPSALNLWFKIGIFKGVETNVSFASDNEVVNRILTTNNHDLLTPYYDNNLKTFRFYKMNRVKLTALNSRSF